MAGRGAGKTYAGARYLLSALFRVGYLRAIGATFADARDVCIEGESGLLAMARPQIEAWNRSLGEVRFTNGARLKMFSADEPDRLRGSQSGCDWYDELAAWRYAEATLDMALMGLRLGTDPRYVVTTTPRPTAVIRRLLSDPTVVTTRAATFDNPHLPEAFKHVILGRYQGTRLGRQEIEAEILDDVPGALWTYASLDAQRLALMPASLTRIVVGVDPKSGDAGTGTCGIVVCARDAHGHAYVLSDMSNDGTPGDWGTAIIRAAEQFHADAVVIETNHGGAMIKHLLRLAPGGNRLRIIEVWAAKGKIARAEPVSVLAQRGMHHHLGTFKALEDEMCTYVPGAPSPNRLDALVWALTELFPLRAGAIQQSNYR